MPRSEVRPRGLLPAAMVAAGLILAAATAIAADGSGLYATCAPCHGVRGEGVVATGAPNIAGMDAWYVERQLRGFATGLRGAQPGDTYGAVMRAAAAGITSDRDRSAVAAYVAGLRRVPASGGAAATDNGRNYFNAICSACHGSGGLGAESLGAPRLAGVQAGYLARQLANFKSGRRGAQAGDRFGAQMRAVTGMLPDVRTEQDVVAYAASLKP